MFALSHKSKQYLLLALKVLILTFTFAYIYLKISQNETISSDYFFNKVINKNSIDSILGFLLLAVLNWFFETLKWKTIVSKIKPISFSTSLKQSLTSLTVSLATPNRIGEYGAKAYFFKKNERKKVMLYNLFHNSFQMLITTLLGIIGLIVIFNKHQLISFSENTLTKLVIAAIVFFGIVLLGFTIRKKQFIIKGLSISIIINKFKELSIGIKMKMILFSLARYLTFSYLFFLLLQFFGASINLNETAPYIFSMYLLASIIPTLSIFDVIIKGGVAVWVFYLIGISEIIVLNTVFCMWVLNFVIPSMVGGYFLMTYKPIRK